MQLKSKLNEHNQNNRANTVEQKDYQEQQIQWLISLYTEIGEGSNMNSEP